MRGNTWNVIINKREFIFVRNSELYDNDWRWHLRKYVPIYTITLSNSFNVHLLYKIQRVAVFLASYYTRVSKSDDKETSWKARRSRTLDTLLIQCGTYKLRQSTTQLEFKQTKKTIYKLKLRSIERCLIKIKTKLIWVRGTQCFSLYQIRNWSILLLSYDLACAKEHCYATSCMPQALNANKNFFQFYIHKKR